MLSFSVGLTVEVSDYRIDKNAIGRHAYDRHMQCNTVQRI